MTIPQAFDLATTRHLAGRLAEAEALYRQILAAQPNHADALHRLGVIAQQVGRHDLAAAMIRQAIVLNPNNSAAHCDLGEACRKMGQLDDAIAAYHRALELRPDFHEAHNNLGVALKEHGRLDDATEEYRRALQIKSDFPEAHSNLGSALRELGRLDEAIAAFRQALELKPNYAEAHNNLGNALMDRGRLDEAAAAFRRALQLKPDFSEAHFNMGNALRGQGQLAEAVAAYRHALRLKPNFPEAHGNMGAALEGWGRFDEAVAACRCALELKPAFPEAHNNLGNALRERGQLDEAVAACRCALQLRPDFPEAHISLGAALAAQGRFDEAMAAYRHALRLKPAYPQALNDLGILLKDQGELDEAIASYRHALQMKPDDARAHSNLIYTLHFHPGHDHRTITEERRRWNRQFGDSQKPFVRPHFNDRDPDRRLRIGYVSPDFRDHVVGRNVMPLIRRHDRRNFEVYCYAGVLRPDDWTDEFRRCAGPWRSTVGLGDEALAELIRGDRIDILVDLTQHMKGNRLAMFARQPAPVQVSFAGYPESTGLEAIEYRISDRYLEAGAADEEAGRERVCLIDSFWCYDPCGIEMEVKGLAARASGIIRFGCLNNFCKVNEPLLSLWARVLAKVADSRLVLLARPGNHRKRIVETLQREGIDSRQVEFVDFRSRREYLELYRELDIVLDTFPYNGHTTSLDAVWMGTPVVSLAGNTPVSRAGLSQLTNLGLPELVAHSEEDYVKIAVELAGDLSRLAELRSTLRDRMKASVLMDATKFTQQIEQAYRSMWKRWRAVNA
jgi:protein O-GlcNAc transferase